MALSGLRQSIRRGIAADAQANGAARRTQDGGAKDLQWSAGNWVDSDAPGNRYSSGHEGKGAALAQRAAAAAGDSWENAAWGACLNYAARNISQAPPIVQEATTNPKKPWERAQNQSAAELLLNPTVGYNRDGEFDPSMSFYGWRQLIYSILLSLHAGNKNGGNAYIGIDTDGAGYPARLWWLPHWKIEPVTIPATAQQPATGNQIDYYEYWVNGRKERREIDEIIHIQFGMNPYDPRKGMSATRAANLGLYTLNQSANYAAMVLRNHGSTSIYVTPKDVGENSPYHDVSFNPTTFTTQFNDAHSGDRVAKVGAFGMPLDIVKLNLSPQDMALDTLPDRSEAEVAALWGFPAQVIGLLVGRHMQSRANLTEAREVAWEETLLPLCTLIGDAFTTQLAPKMRGYKAKPVTRVYFDITDIRPLQPDVDATHKRVREDYKYGIIDRYEARLETGRDGRDEDKDIFFSAGGAAGMEDEEEEEEGTERENATPGAERGGPKEPKNGKTGKRRGMNGHAHKSDDTLRVSDITGDEPIRRDDFVSRVATELAVLNAGE